MLVMAHTLDPAPREHAERGATAVLVLKLTALSAAAIVAGGTFTFWRGYPPQGLSSTAFVEMQQDAIRGLNALLPATALAGIVATLVLAWLSHGLRRRWFLFAAALLVLAGFITRFGNQPINAIVMTWTPTSPPAGWETLRDRWWTLHLTRTAFTCAGYLVLAIGCLLPADPPSAPRQAWRVIARRRLADL